jgi:hypothetical protein
VLADGPVQRSKTWRPTLWTSKSSTTFGNFKDGGCGGPGIPQPASRIAGQSSPARVIPTCPIRMKFQPTKPNRGFFRSIKVEEQPGNPLAPSKRYCLYSFNSF